MSGVAPGWYPDPDPRAGGGSTLRWWDGERWTERRSGPGRGPAYGQDPRATTPDGQELAGWGRRLGAYVIDSIATSLLGLALGFAFWRDIAAYYVDLMATSFDAAARGGAATTPGPLDAYADIGWALAGAVAVSFGTALAYHVFFLRRTGATPGKQLLGLRVRLRDHPGQLPLGAIGRRLAVVFVPGLLGVVPVVGAVFSAIPFLDGLWPLWDGERQALHDKAAGTNVVRVR